MQRALVDHEVAERRSWKKFGKERGKQAGPDLSTTTVDSAITLKLSAGNKVRNSLTFIVAFGVPSS